MLISVLNARKFLQENVRTDVAEDASGPGKFLLPLNTAEVHHDQGVISRYSIKLHWLI